MQKITFLLIADPEILFTVFAKSSKLQEINPTFDACKQVQGVQDKIFTGLIHFRK